MRFSAKQRLSEIPDVQLTCFPTVVRQTARNPSLARVHQVVLDRRCDNGFLNIVSSHNPSALSGTCASVFRALEPPICHKSLSSWIIFHSHVRSGSCETQGYRAQMEDGIIAELAVGRPRPFFFLSLAIHFSFPHIAGAVQPEQRGSHPGPKATFPHPLQVRDPRRDQTGGCRQNSGPS